MARDTQRETIYEEPSLLDMPEPPPGLTYRWLRVQLLADQGYIDDVKNVSLQEREGWTPVREDELPEDWYGRLPTRETGRYKGIVGHSDVALFKIPTEMFEARKSYMERKAFEMERAINEQLRQASGQKGGAMPIFNDSSSKVTTGSRATQFDD